MKVLSFCGGLASETKLVMIAPLVRHSTAQIHKSATMPPGKRRLSSVRP